MPRLKSKTDKVLAPIRPNVGIEAAYRRKLVALIDEMNRSILYWVSSAYRRNEPEISLDESPAAAMRAAIRKLRRRWFDRFDTAAKELGDYFATAVAQRSDAALKSILKRGGFAVEFRMTRAQNDVIQATIGENVALIRNLPQQYLTGVESAVMRSVQTGRDLKQLSDDLQTQFGITKRRAALISRDQNNKATSALVRARHLELGITQAVWTHSGGGKTQRPKHVKASGSVYEVAKGLPIGDKGQWVHPGEEISCRCVNRAVVKGFS